MTANRYRTEIQLRESGVDVLRYKKPASGDEPGWFQTEAAAWRDARDRLMRLASTIQRKAEDIGRMLEQK